MHTAERSNAVPRSAMQTKHADFRVTARDIKTSDRSCAVFDLRATESDIDHMGHVNNAVYLIWVQDVVVRHWTSLASEVEFAAYLWVAVKHEITYRRPAFLGDDLSATVRATGFRGAKAMFDTAIRRGDEIVAEVKSIWCCLDTTTKRPIRIAQTVVTRFTREGLPA